MPNRFAIKSRSIVALQELDRRMRAVVAEFYEPGMIEIRVGRGIATGSGGGEAGALIVYDEPRPVPSSLQHLNLDLGIEQDPPAWLASASIHLRELQLAFASVRDALVAEGRRPGLVFASPSATLVALDGFDGAFPYIVDAAPQFAAAPHGLCVPDAAVPAFDALADAMREGEVAALIDPRPEVASAHEAMRLAHLRGVGAEALAWIPDISANAAGERVVFSKRCGALAAAVDAQFVMFLDPILLHVPALGGGGAERLDPGTLWRRGSSAAAD